MPQHRRPAGQTGGHGDGPRVCRPGAAQGHGQGAQQKARLQPQSHAGGQRRHKCEGQQPGPTTMYQRGPHRKGGRHGGQGAQRRAPLLAQSVAGRQQGTVAGKSRQRGQKTGQHQPGGLCSLGVKRAMTKQSPHQGRAHGPEARNSGQTEQQGQAQGRAQGCGKIRLAALRGQAAQGGQTGRAQARAHQAQGHFQQTFSIIETGHQTRSQAGGQSRRRQQAELRRAGPQQARGRARQTAPGSGPCRRYGGRCGRRPCRCRNDSLRQGGSGAPQRRPCRPRSAQGAARAPPQQGPLGQARAAHAQGQGRGRRAQPQSRRPGKGQGHDIEQHRRKPRQPEQAQTVQQGRAQGRHAGRQPIGQTEAQQKDRQFPLRPGKARSQSCRQPGRGRYGQKKQQGQRCSQAHSQGAAHLRKVSAPRRRIWTTMAHQSRGEAHGQGAFPQQAAQGVRQAQGGGQSVRRGAAAHQPGHAHIPQQPQQTRSQGIAAQPGRCAGQLRRRSFRGRRRVGLFCHWPHGGRPLQGCGDT